MKQEMVERTKSLRFIYGEKRNRRIIRQMLHKLSKKHIIRINVTDRGMLWEVRCLDCANFRKAMDIPTYTAITLPAPEFGGTIEHRCRTLVVEVELPPSKEACAVRREMIAASNIVELRRRDECELMKHRARKLEDKNG